jgi:hypothetical protein
MLHFGKYIGLSLLLRDEQYDVKNIENLIAAQHGCLEREKHSLGGGGEHYANLRYF